MKIIFLITCFLLINSCSLVKEIMAMQKPTVTGESIKLTGISFDKLEGVFTLKIKNPNAISIKFNSLDFKLAMYNKIFLDGNKNTSFDIAANAESEIKIPVELKFDELFKLFKELGTADEFSYQFSANLNIYVPVINDVKIPISISGTLPVVRLPEINFGSLKKRDFTFIKGAFDLELEITNPNKFNLELPEFNYNFSISNTSIVKGKTSSLIKAKEKSKLLIPFNIEFLSMGTVVYNLLTGSKELNYELQTQSTFKIDLPFFKPISKSKKLEGRIKL
jgi:LEA14-like dessication related protein